MCIRDRAYGILMASSGYPAWLAVLMSVAVYAGSMQFAAVPLLAVPDPLGALLLALLVNARHVFYGISMMNQYRDAGRCRPYLILSLIHICWRPSAKCSAAAWKSCTISNCNQGPGRPKAPFP